MTPQTFALLQWGHRLSAMETWQPRAGMEPDYVLQWGHRLSAMETHLLLVEKGELILPSMGPPPFSDGNRF